MLVNKLKYISITYKDKINTLEQKNNKIKQEIIILGEENKEVIQENNDLKKEITELTSKNQTLQNNFDLLLRILLQQNS